MSRSEKILKKTAILMFGLALGYSSFAATTADTTKNTELEKLIRNHLFKNEGEEYGYYVLKYHTTRTSNILPACLHTGLLYILPLFAVPTHLVDFDLKVDLYLFDSQGNLVKKYKSSDSFRQVAGLYYGHNPQRKMERKYSELYDGLFRKANQEAEYINNILLKSGPIGDKNRKQAKTNIEMFFKTDEKK